MDEWEMNAARVPAQGGDGMDEACGTPAWPPACHRARCVLARAGPGWKPRRAMKREPEPAARRRCQPLLVLAPALAIASAVVIVCSRIRDREMMHPVETLVLVAVMAALLGVLLWSLRRVQADWARAVESEANLAATLRSIGDAVITTDADGRVATMNSVAERYTGWPEAEARGRGLNEILQLIDRESGDFLTNSFSRVLGAKATVHLPPGTVR
jgi:PAS domain-containing protein